MMVKLPKLYILVLFLILSILVIAGILYYLGYFSNDKGLSSNERVVVDNKSQDTAPSIPKAQEEVSSEQEFKLEVVASNLFVPWSIVFTSSDRMLFSERNGRLNSLVNGKVSLVKEFSEVRGSGEEGLMSIALDPDYSGNQLIYICLAYPSSAAPGGFLDKVVRFKDNNNSLSEEKILLDKIPAASNHAGCRIKFGPDKKLYITTGDATDRKIAQDKNSLGGKILRINPDGSIPTDNPFVNSPIWSLGHRNPQGIDWHPVTGDLFESEHGPSGFDGPGGGDEINIIRKGENYGWPIVSHKDSQEGLVDPLLVFTPAIAPAAAMFYQGEALPGFKNNFFVGLLRGEGMLRVVLDENDSTKVKFYEKLKDITVGRVREVSLGPDGFIYFSTSNRDGRGELRNDDDKIYRIVPK